MAWYRNPSATVSVNAAYNRQGLTPDSRRESDLLGGRLRPDDWEYVVGLLKTEWDRNKSPHAKTILDKLEIVP